MQKRSCIKIVAIAVCLVFIRFSASGMFAANKNSRIDSLFLLRKPVQFLVPIFTGFDSIFNIHKEQILFGGNSGSPGR